MNSTYIISTNIKKVVVAVGSNFGAKQMLKEASYMHDRLIK